MCGSADYRTSDQKQFTISDAAQRKMIGKSCVILRREIVIVSVQKLTLTLILIPSRENEI